MYTIMKETSFLYDELLAESKREKLFFLIKEEVRVKVYYVQV